MQVCYKLERMTTVLVHLHNATLKHKHYPKRWLDVLDVMIEKGKGSRINKLRVIQIVEADLQLLMRTFLLRKIKSFFT